MDAKVADDSVKSWYTANYGPTSYPCKAIDWALATYEVVHNKDVLNVGPDYPVDEVYLGAWAKSWTALDFTPATVDRLEAFRPALERLSGKPYRFVLGDMRSMPFPDKSFDVVLDLSSSDHVSEGRNRAYSEFWRVLRPQGLLVLTYANINYFPGRPADGIGDYGFEHLFTPEEIKAEMDLAGFEILNHDTHFDRSGVLARAR